MKILMVGNLIDSNSNNLYSLLSTYSHIHNIPFRYEDILTLDNDNMSILNSKNIRTFPVFIIYKGEEILVLSGDDIFIELESL